MFTHQSADILGGSPVSHRWWRTQPRVVVAILKRSTKSQDDDEEQCLTSGLHSRAKKNRVILKLLGSSNVCKQMISACTSEVKTTFLNNTG